MVYCCLEWIYPRGRAWARRPCKSPRHRSVPIYLATLLMGWLWGPRSPWGPCCGARPSLPSLPRSPARRKANKMVIMPQTSSGKGFETDEKPYLRVRPLLLITWSQAVNSADTAIMGNQPAPAPAPHTGGCPGVGWGQVSGGWGGVSSPQGGANSGEKGKNLWVGSSRVLGDGSFGLWEACGCE